MTAIAMRPNRLQRAILAVMPWYHEAEVEARHAATQAAILESRASVGRAIAVTEGVQRAKLRESYVQIGQRLDER
jgi:hypothetical protein